jgi:hypothetical protein
MSCEAEAITVEQARSASVSSLSSSANIPALESSVRSRLLGISILFMFPPPAAVNAANIPLDDARIEEAKRGGIDFGQTLLLRTLIEAGDRSGL